MEIFTYQDYLKYQKFLEAKHKTESGVHEENETYIFA